MTQATPLSGMVAIRRLTLHIACKHTKFDDASFGRSEDISWGVGAKVGHVTLTTPLSGAFCHRQTGTNLLTKFEVSIFSRYGNMKGAAKC